MSQAPRDKDWLNSKKITLEKLENITDAVGYKELMDSTFIHPSEKSAMLGYGVIILCEYSISDCDLFREQAIAILRAYPHVLLFMDVVGRSVEVLMQLLLYDPTKEEAPS